MRSVLAALFLLSIPGTAAPGDAQFNGRWDISVPPENGRPRGWWLEVMGAGTDALKGKFAGASADLLDQEIPKLSIFDGELRFVLERRYRREQKTMQKGLFWARIEEGKLKGTFEIEGDPATYLEWTGVRAPELPEKDDGSWKRGDPVPLFNGHDLAGWQTVVPGKPPNWIVREAILQGAANASDLASDKKFWNFDLHVEFLVPLHGGGGIGLRGRYETQILDDFGNPPSKRSTGAIYGRIAPRVNAAKAWGEWQTLDIRLIGRQVSVALNNVRVIDKTAIDGPTSLAIDSNEGDPGPLVLQGGAVQFRKIVVYPLMRQAAIRPVTKP